MIAVEFTRVQGNTYSIQCIYPNGSNASGCVYILVSGEEGVQNGTGAIEGGDATRILVPDIGCYSEVLAFGLPSGNTSKLAARAIITTDKVCSVNTGGLFVFLCYWQVSISLILHCGAFSEYISKLVAIILTVVLLLSLAYLAYDSILESKFMANTPAV